MSVYTCLCVYTRVWACVFINAYACVYMCVHMCVHVLCSCAVVHTCVRNVRVRACVCMCICVLPTAHTCHLGAGCPLAVLGHVLRSCRALRGAVRSYSRKATAAVLAPRRGELCVGLAPWTSPLLPSPPPRCCALDLGTPAACVRRLTPREAPSTRGHKLLGR